MESASVSSLLRGRRLDSYFEAIFRSPEPLRKDTGVHQHLQLSRPSVSAEGEGVADFADDDRWITVLISVIRILACVVTMMATTIFWTAVMLVLLPCPYLRVRQGNLYGHVTGRLMMWILGNPIKIEGLEFSNTRAIYLCNHASPLDIFLVMWLAPIGTVGIAKKELAPANVPTGRRLQKHQCLVWMGAVIQIKNLLMLPVADWAKSKGVEQFLFISSAGIYKPSNELPHVEEDPVKDDAGHAVVERYIAGLSFSSWAIFRPQYIIASGNNKDCEEWFFDRIVRGRPVLIPGSGMQLTNISHVRDLSSMLSLAVADPIASSQKIFNCVSDRAVTFDGLAKLCAQAAGLDANIIHYDPKSVGVDAKKAFPFRNMHFYAEPRAAKGLLGWTSTTNLPENLKERFGEYVRIGRDKKELNFDFDDKILESLKEPVMAV